jgi:hypothetical protein
MFSQTLKDSMEKILDDLKHKRVSPDIFESCSVIKILTHMRYLILLSESVWETEAEKYMLFDTARKQAIEMYESRMYR